MHRESWNTTAVNSFTPRSTRESLHQVSHEKYAANAFSSSKQRIKASWSHIPPKRNKKHSCASCSQFLSHNLNTSPLAIPTSTIKCRMKRATPMIFQGCWVGILHVMYILSHFSQLSKGCLPYFFKDFIPNLKDYALCKILGLEHDTNEIAFTKADWASVTFVKNRIYQHKVLCVNYMTYDMWREQDSLNPRTHANVMVLSQEDDPSAHPYWYARIISIYHTWVCHQSSLDPILIEFLWICWYGLNFDWSSHFGWKFQRLPKVGFVPDSPDAGSPAFGFLDPAQVIQGVHLIPCFSEGDTGDLLEPLLAWLPHKGDLDWQCYYVNM